ncbi:MAG TPA: hypothetical protein VLU95_08905 [Candidatus Acidoferrum sp.]|nr:hypothetical protein [Candidatus Acidoferrum sp.]
MSADPVEISRFDAENATALTADFLKRLGYKGNWLPMKVSLDGELYVVEMMFQKLNAKVQINSKTKEIKEYELQEGEGESKSFLKSKGIMFIIAAIPSALLVVKLLGIF